MNPAPATRKPRPSTHLRAALVAGMGLLALAAVGWALVTADGDGAFEERPDASMAVVEDTPSGPSTATLVETPPQPSAPANNPFESSSVPEAAEPADAATDPVAATLAAAANATAAPAASANPFSAMQTPARGPGNVRTAPAPAAVAPRPTATAKPPVASAPRAAPPPPPAREAGLLQTLMDNIQQPPVPERDTRAMDRLARQLDRAPMPETSAAGATVASVASPPSKPSTTVAAVDAGAGPAPIATPARAVPTTVAPQEKQTLRAMLDRCPSAGSPQGQRCRRQMCARAGVEPRLCTRH
jgi:hypothetical protein